MNEQHARIRSIVGGTDELRYADAVQRFRDHVGPRMRFPFEVTGREPFRWEVPFLEEGGAESAAEYRRLKQSQPSYEEQYTALGFDDGFSTWMRYEEEDITVDVRRKRDRKQFWLGLAELRVIDRASSNFQLVDDYVAWVRSRTAAP